MANKASLSALPLECLQLVLVDLQDDQPTLANLLCVNRHLCTATLPYLYKRALYSPLFGFNMMCSIHPRCFSVVRLLLQQLPRSEVSDLLCATFDLFPEEGESHIYADDRQDPGRQLIGNNSNNNAPSSTNFISYINDFDFEAVLFSPLYGTQKSKWEKNYPTRLRALVFAIQEWGLCKRHLWRWLLRRASSFSTPIHGRKLESV